MNASIKLYIGLLLTVVAMTQIDARRNEKKDCCKEVIKINAHDINKASCASKDGLLLDREAIYQLCENVSWKNSTPSSYAITITGEDVTLDLGGNFIEMANTAQTSANANNYAIQVASTARRVVIKNGSIRGISGGAIIVQPDVVGITIEDINVYNSCYNGARFIPRIIQQSLRWNWGVAIFFNTSSEVYYIDQPTRKVYDVILRHCNFYNIGMLSQDDQGNPIQFVPNFDPTLPKDQQYAGDIACVWGNHCSNVIVEDVNCNNTFGDHEVFCVVFERSSAGVIRNLTCNGTRSHALNKSILLTNNVGWLVEDVTVNNPVCTLVRESITTVLSDPVYITNDGDAGSEAIKIFSSNCIVRRLKVANAQCYVDATHQEMIASGKSLAITNVVQTTNAVPNASGIATFTVPGNSFLPNQQIVVAGLIVSPTQPVPPFVNANVYVPNTYLFVKDVYPAAGLQPGQFTASFNLGTGGLGGPASTYVSGGYASGGVAVTWGHAAVATHNSNNVIFEDSTIEGIFSDGGLLLSNENNLSNVYGAAGFELENSSNIMYQNCTVSNISSRLGIVAGFINAPLFVVPYPVPFNAGNKNTYQNCSAQLLQLFGGTKYAAGFLLQGESTSTIGNTFTRIVDSYVSDVLGSPTNIPVIGAGSSTTSLPGYGILFQTKTSNGLVSDTRISRCKTSAIEDHQSPTKTNVYYGNYAEFSPSVPNAALLQSVSVAPTATGGSGSGYAVGNILNISANPAGAGGQVIVTSVGPAGSVTGVALINPGAGYSTGTAATTGGGDNLASVTLFVGSQNYNGLNPAVYTNAIQQNWLFSGPPAAVPSAGSALANVDVHN